MKYLAIAACVLALAACADATSDLPKGNQDIEDRDVDVYRMPDQFPNVAFLCTDQGAGVYANTRTNGNNMEVVVTDPACDPE